jgi:hypothetical protein
MGPVPSEGVFGVAARALRLVDGPHPRAGSGGCRGWRAPCSRRAAGCTRLVSDPAAGEPPVKAGGRPSSTKSYCSGSLPGNVHTDCYAMVRKERHAHPSGVVTVCQRYSQTASVTRCASFSMARVVVKRGCNW